MRIYHVGRAQKGGVLAGCNTAKPQKSWALESRAMQNESVKKYFAGKVAFGGFDSIESSREIFVRARVRFWYRWGSQEVSAEMENRMIERIAEIAERHSSAITIGTAIWFWLGVAVYARFIPLPDIPESVRDGFFWASIGANALWWGYFHGKVQERREAIREADEQKSIDQQD